MLNGFVSHLGRCEVFLQRFQIGCTTSRRQPINPRVDVAHLVVTRGNLAADHLMEERKLINYNNCAFGEEQFLLETRK